MEGASSCRWQGATSNLEDSRGRVKVDTTEQGIYQRLQGAAESLEEGSYVMMKPLCIHYSRLGPDKEFNYLEE